METPKKFNTPIFKDNRGSFTPIQIENNWVQSNLSINDDLFTWRGLHFQSEPKEQSKYVSVVRGKIVDILVCLSEDNLGKVEIYELSEGEGVFVPKGYAHGFLTLESGTIVNYFVDEIYSKEHEVSIHWTSIPEVKEIVDSYIKNNQLIISTKDNFALEFKEYIKK